MHDSWILTLPADVRVSNGRDGELVIDGPRERIVLRTSAPAVQRAFERLAHPGEQFGQLLAEVKTGGEPGETARFLYHLQQLARKRSLQIILRDGERDVATLVPTSPMFSFAASDLSAERYVLSRFAHIRRLGEGMALESPLFAARLLLHNEDLLILLHRLSLPNSISEMNAPFAGLSGKVVTGFFCMLADLQMITPLKQDQTDHDPTDESWLTAEDCHPSLRFWEFHDLLFHASSRDGRHDRMSGATFPWAGFAEVPPVAKAVEAAEVIPLYLPEIAALPPQDSFTSILEQRESIREYAAEPITAEQLGEFLYRWARDKARFHYDVETPAGPIEMEFVARSYPAAGALYELEIYPVIQVCAGLEAGMYHYNPGEHQLARMSAEPMLVAQLLTDAAEAACIPVEELQVLFVLSARFSRMFWKYTSLAYAATLKNVGVVFQSMYLTATAMNLAPCAIGVGNADLFAQALGSDYYAETSVGEFLLGSKPNSNIQTP